MLAGCSQTAALAPVGGDRLAEVRFAANDVLVDKGIELGTAPVCSASGDDDAEIACSGGTLSGQQITVRSTAAQPDVLVVTVGSTTLYKGSLMAVLDAHAEPTSTGSPS